MDDFTSSHSIKNIGKVDFMMIVRKDDDGIGHRELQFPLPMIVKKDILRWNDRERGFLLTFCYSSGSHTPMVTISPFFP